MPNIKYTWRTKTGDPKEINGVTLFADAVPRIGDSVMINVPISDKESAQGSGRVGDVIWKHRHDGLEVEVILG
jgi:hypothetical protein